MGTNLRQASGNKILQKVQPNIHKNSSNYHHLSKRSRSSSRKNETKNSENKQLLKIYQDPKLEPDYLLNTQNIVRITYSVEQSHNMEHIEDNFQYLRYREERNPEINQVSETFCSQPGVFPSIKQRSLL